MGLKSGPARRSVLKAALAVGLGAGVAGCSRFTDLYEPGEARRVLDELRRRAGEGETVRYLFDRSSMQLAVIKPDRPGTQQWFSWDRSGFSERSDDFIDDSRIDPDAFSIDDPQAMYAAAAASPVPPTDESFSCLADSGGKPHLTLSFTSAFLPDGSLVPYLDFSAPADVRTAFAEIVAANGALVNAIGVRGYTDPSVYADAPRAGRSGLYRITRAAGLDPEGGVLIDEKFDQTMAFDPSGLDPRIAMDLAPSIAETAGVTGRLWSWYAARRPDRPDPVWMFNVLDESDTPKDTTISVDLKGALIDVVATGADCANGFCPDN